MYLCILLATMYTTVLYEDDATTGEQNQDTPSRLSLGGATPHRAPIDQQLLWREKTHRSNEKQKSQLSFSFFSFLFCRKEKETQQTKS